MRIHCIAQLSIRLKGKSRARCRPDRRSARAVTIREALGAAGDRIEAIIIDAGRIPVSCQAKKAVRMVASGGIRESSDRVWRKLQRAVVGLRGARKVGFYHAVALSTQGA